MTTGRVWTRWTLDPACREAVLGEVKIAFELKLALFDELDTLGGSGSGWADDRDRRS